MSRPFPLALSFKGKSLENEPAAIRECSHDYGNITTAVPRAIVRPSSLEDIAAVITTASKSNVALAIRGRGHSLRGQSLVSNGVVIDMQSMARVTDCTATAIQVQAGADWSHVLRHSMSLGAVPPVLPNYLGLSIGGTICVGGVGEATFRHGLVADSVLSLDVVTGTGEPLTCSPCNHAELFEACKAGLGQFAVVVSANISLTPSVPRSRIFHLLYADVEAFLSNLKQLASSPTPLAGLRGLAIPNRREHLEFVLGDAHRSVWVSPSRFPWLFVLTLTLAAAADSSFLEDLDYIPGGMRIEEPPPGALPVSAPINPDLVHPWVDLFIPGARAAGFLTQTLGKFEPSGVGGPILLYPIVSSRLSPSFCRMPDDDFVVLLSVSRAIAPGDPELLSKLLAENRAIYKACRAIGGFSYPIGSLGLQADDWRDHFGPRWDYWQSVKERYDPNHILSPGQMIAI